MYLANNSKQVSNEDDLEQPDMKSSLLVDDPPTVADLQKEQQRLSQTEANKNKTDLSSVKEIAELAEDSPDTLAKSNQAEKKGNISAFKLEPVQKSPFNNLVK